MGCALFWCTWEFTFTITGAISSAFSLRASKVAPAVPSPSWKWTGLFFKKNFSLQLDLFVYASWKMCGNISRWKCTDSNCAVERTSSVRMNPTELIIFRVTASCWLFEMSLKHESFLLPTCCLLVLGYSVWVMGHLNHFSFYNHCASLCEVFLVLLWKLGQKSVLCQSRL